MKKVGSKELERFLIERSGKEREVMSPFHNELSAWN